MRLLVCNILTLFSRCWRSSTDPNPLAVAALIILDCWEPPCSSLLLCWFSGHLFSFFSTHIHLRNFFPQNRFLLAVALPNDLSDSDQSSKISSNSLLRRRWCCHYPGFMFLFVCQQLVRDLHGKTKSRWVSDFGPFEEIFNGILIWLGAGDA